MSITVVCDICMDVQNEYFFKSKLSFSRVQLVFIKLFH